MHQRNGRFPRCRRGDGTFSWKLFLTVSFSQIFISTRGFFRQSQRCRANFVSGSLILRRVEKYFLLHRLHLRARAIDFEVAVSSSEIRRLIRVRRYPGTRLRATSYKFNRSFYAKHRANNAAACFVSEDDDDDDEGEERTSERINERTTTTTSLRRCRARACARAQSIYRNSPVNLETHGGFISLHLCH